MEFHCRRFVRYASKLQVDCVVAVDFLGNVSKPQIGTLRHSDIGMCHLTPTPLWPLVAQTLGDARAEGQGGVHRGSGVRPQRGA